MSQIRFVEQAEPATPPTDRAILYVDEVDKEVAIKTDDGVVKKFLSASGVTETFVSAQIPIVSGGGILENHGLSAAPDIVLPFLICLAAEDGYSIGEIIPMGYDSDSTTNRGVGWHSDATVIEGSFGSSGAVFTYVNKATGSRTQLTNVNWELIIKAFAFV